MLHDCNHHKYSNVLHHLNAKIDHLFVPFGRGLTNVITGVNIKILPPILSLPTCNWLRLQQTEPLDDRTGLNQPEHIK